MFILKCQYFVYLQLNAVDTNQGILFCIDTKIENKKKLFKSLFLNFINLEISIDIKNWIFLKT